MDLDKTLAELKKTPGFADRVGMVLIHNGVVRGYSRDGQKKIKELSVKPDQETIAAIKQEYGRWPGIFAVLIQAREGIFRPGDDLLHIIVAGDIRENVKPVLSEVLEAVKTKAMHKEERETT